MTKTKKSSLKLLSFLLTLAMVVGLVPGMSLTASAIEIRVSQGELQVGTIINQNDRINFTYSVNLVDGKVKFAYPYNLNVYMDGTNVKSVSTPKQNKAPDHYYSATKKCIVVSFSDNRETTDRRVSLYLKSLEISDATIENITNTSFTYDGSSHYPTVTVKNASGETLTYNTDYTLESQTNAGTYSVKVTGEGNYTGSKTVSDTWSISKGTNTFTTQPVPADSDYTGQPIPLLSGGGAAKWGTIEYSTDNVSWSTNIPEKTDAGTYTVYYRVPATGNYDEISGSVSSSIKKYTALTEENKPTISISSDHDTPQIGDVLTAETTAAPITYSWHYYGSDTPLGTESTYTVKKEDFDKQIVVTVTQNEDETGNAITGDKPTQTSEATDEVVKKTPDTLSADDAKNNAGINYVPETATPNSGYEVSTDGTNKADSSVSLTSVLDDDSPKIYVRTAETDDTAAGEWVAVTLTTRPDAPIGLTSEPPAGTANGKIKGTTDGMEYKLKDSTGAWTTASSSETEVPAGIYLVRIKATENAPAGKTTEVTVGPDKTALNNAITAAETLYDSIKNNTDYTDIASTLKTAINTAKAVADSDEADKDAIDAATTAITDAKTNAEKAMFDAYKTEQKNAADDMALDGDSAAATKLITDAKNAIDALTYDTSKTLDENKAAVTAVVTQLTTDLADQRAADEVIKKINALPENDDITSANKEAIEAAREAYDALTPAQKAKVGDEAKKKLEAAEVALAIAELPSADAVTSSDKTAIEAARAKYDALTDAQKEQVGEDALAKLEAVEAALLIAQLPEASSVTTADKTAIEKAREAYDALTDAQKAQVGDTLKEKLEAAEVALTKKLIEAIPDPADVTTADADKVAAAKTAYDKLTDDQKTKITEAEKEKLDAAVQALSDAETSHVEDLIKALPSASSVTTADAAAIEAAKEAFDELTEAQKAIVKTTLKDKLAADLVALAIAKLPAADNVTAADKDAIEAARAAYDALTSTQKSSVGEAAKAKLEAAEAKIQDAVDTEAANAVRDKINALPASTAVTANDKAAIEAARAAYDALTDNQKAKIDTDTLKKLTDAEAAIQDAEDKAAADAVNATIDALPGADDVTVSDKAAIEAARAAYDALKPEQKDQIDTDTLKKLTDAEDALALAESEDKLDKTISSATAYYDSIKNRYPAIAGTLKNAIKAAQAVIDDENAEKANIDAAVTALNTAVSTARTAVSYAGGGSSTPSYVPSYSPSSTTTTTTTSSSVDSASSKAKMWAVQNDDKSSITVGWDKVTGATKYTLYVRKNGKLEKVVDTKKTKVLIKNPANNTNLEYVLKYTIGGVESAESSAYTASIKVYYKPAVKATSKNGAVTLKWNKVPEATKYRVYKYVNGKLVKVADTTANAVRLKNVTTGKTYKYAVKAYVDGKWTKVTKSDIVSVKAK